MRYGSLSICLLASVFSAPAGTESAYRTFDDPSLAQGRVLWLDHCETCHGYGIAGAPIPMRAEDWRPRLARDRSQLYLHAIEGFFGPEDTYMPPRGGNPQLSDEQVRLAVDYMVDLAGYYLRQQEKQP